MKRSHIEGQAEILLFVTVAPTLISSREYYDINFLFKVSEGENMKIMLGFETIFHYSTSKKVREFNLHRLLELTLRGVLKET